MRQIIANLFSPLFKKGGVSSERNEDGTINITYFDYMEVFWKQIILNSKTQYNVDIIDLI